MLNSLRDGYSGVGVREMCGVNSLRSITARLLRTVRNGDYVTFCNSVKTNGAALVGILYHLVNIRRRIGDPAFTLIGRCRKHSKLVCRFSFCHVGSPRRTLSLKL